MKNTQNPASVVSLFKPLYDILVEMELLEPEEEEKFKHSVKICDRLISKLYSTPGFDLDPIVEDQCRRIHSVSENLKF